MMKRKTWALLSLALLLGTIGAICLTVIVIDPFQVYHLATRYMPPIDNTTQVYANAGIARSYDYDSAVVGTSVTENFRPTQMDALLGGRFIKLCTSAGTAYNHALLMDLAFRTHDVKRIVYGLDVYSFIAKVDQTGSDVPMYLYDDNLFNDVSYWLNRSVLGSFLPRCLKAWGQKQDDSIRDRMYNWAGRDDYGPIALYTASFTPPENPLPADARTQLAQENLNAHLIAYITAHPETQFDIFFPPYSAAHWYQFYTQGQMEYHLQQKKALAEALLPYDNVEIYDFQARTEWICDLNQYIDAKHYGPDINDAMAEEMAAGLSRVTDAAQLEANNNVIRALAAQIVEAGDWPF